MGIINWLRSWGAPAPAAPAPQGSWIKQGVVPINLIGSLQNPAWSPEGLRLSFTRFLNGYNMGPADIWTYSFVTKELLCVIRNGSDNVSQPGSCWSRNGEIIFSSDYEGGGDQIYCIRSDGSGLRKLPQIQSPSTYEPSWAPNGKDYVVEAHPSGGRGGEIVICYDNRAPALITSMLADCRQPNWSPTGRHIVYQENFGGRWELFLYDVQSGNGKRITAGIPGDKTDATFSPDGQFILFSGTRSDGSDGLMKMTLSGDRSWAIDHGPGYFGAASWSSAGWIAAETSEDDPENSYGTKIVIVDGRK